MRKIKELNVARLRVEECFGFLKRIEALTELLTLETDKEMVADFTAALTAFDEALKAGLKNSKTTEVEAADMGVDKSWRLLTQLTKAFTDHPEEVISAAATEVYTIVQKYGDITGMAYNEEYGNLHNALQDLTTVNSAKQELLRIDRIVYDLQTGYEAFIKASAERDAEAAQKQVGIVKQMRTAAENAYRTLVSRVNALVVVNGEEAYAEFIDQANVVIDSAKTTLANRSTRAANAKKKK